MNDRYLKTGIFLAPFHPLHENPLLAIERDMELLEHLDRLNYHEAWIGEHHSAGFEIIACPEMFIAAAAERTRHIRLGTGVVSLPYHNPFTVAGRMMQLDYMTRGRAMFGVGPGSLVYDATKMGLKAEDQRRKLDESLDVIMELMQGRMVTKKTDWFDLHGGAPAAQELLAADDGDGGRLLALADRRARRPASTASACCRSAARPTMRSRRTPATGASTRRLPAPTARRPTAASGASSPSPTSRRRKEQARKDVKFGLDDFRRYFTEVATFPIIPPDVTGDPAEYLVVLRPRLHRHARRLHAPFRAAVEGLQRRLRRRPAAGAQLGGLAGDASAATS